MPYSTFDNTIMENWNKICRLMKKYANRETEMEYQISVKDLFLENGLGWRDDQICEQLTLPLGSTERLIPDIVVTKNDCDKFVIEIKKPGHIKTQRNIDQLISYMKQIETPVGVYIGDEIEVYYKRIGDGSQPVKVMSVEFEPENELGKDLVSLFSENKYSIDSIVKYVEEQESKEIFKENVERLCSKLLSGNFHDDLYCLLKKHLINQGENEDVVDEALTRLEFNVNIPISKTDTIDKTEISPVITDSYRTKVSRRHNNGIVQRYAYGLVKQILERNPSLNFRQLYAIFDRKNFIADITEVQAKSADRWCMDEDDIITVADGTRVVISNQWGMKNGSKPKMDRLKSIAKSYGIEV